MAGSVIPGPTWQSLSPELETQHQTPAPHQMRVSGNARKPSTEERGVQATLIASYRAARDNRTPPRKKLKTKQASQPLM